MSSLALSIAAVVLAQRALQILAAGLGDLAGAVSGLVICSRACRRDSTRSSENPAGCFPKASAAVVFSPVHSCPAQIYLCSTSVSQRWTRNPIKSAHRALQRRAPTVLMFAHR